MHQHQIIEITLTLHADVLNEETFILPPPKKGWLPIMLESAPT